MDRFDERYQDVAGTAQDIILGTGQYAISLSALQAATDPYYKLMCVIRQDTDTGIWSILDDTSHSPTNVDSITQDSDQIRINYSFTASKIKTFVAVPDDVLNKTGLQFGGDVGTTYANITIAKPAQMGAFISSDSNGNLIVADSMDNDLTAIEYTANQIVITHNKALSALAPIKITNHGAGTKFEVYPIDSDQTTVTLALRRRGLSSAALFTATSNVFTVTAGSDNGYSVASWSAGTLTINTPSVDGWDFTVECGKTDVKATATTVTSNQMAVKFWDMTTSALLTTVPDNFYIKVSRKDTGPIPNNLTANDVAFFFEREGLLTGTRINPSTIMPEGNNIWVFGMFE